MNRRLCLVALFPLAACAHQRVAVAPPALPPAAPAAVAVVPPPAPRRPSTMNARLTMAATVWHLRAGLNVAALACRGAGADAIVARYNALLDSQKTSLAAAQTSLTAEYRASGPRWQDRQDDAMTRLYNFWSQAPAREAFCTAAARILADTATLAPADLPAFAAARLPELDAPFAALEPAPLPPTVLAIAAPFAPAPNPALAMARRAGPAPRPHLQLDLSSLPTER